MPRVAPRVPELSEVLCSSCGYVLNGLPENANCPECGQPIALSLGSDRVMPEWESAQPGKKLAGFVSSSLKILFSPRQFYRTLNVRGALQPARSFAKIHWWIAAVLFGLSAAIHAAWFSYYISPSVPNFPGGKWSLFATLSIVLTIASYFFLDMITRLAGKLTNWEGTYRGYRLPYEIVLRGMYYHAAHYFPVALSALIVVGGYQLILAWRGPSLPYNSPTIYLYVLCGQIVISALYLFQTYWIGMRNMMYANR